MSYGYGSRNYLKDDVKRFLNQFRQNVESGQARLIYQSYEGFLRMTQETFKVSSWPRAETVMKALNLNSVRHEIFHLLYNELFYRHMFDKCDMEYEDMCDAFQNYINLFNKILERSNDFPHIPEKWLWEMVNSFVSQFQYYHHWKNDKKNLEKLIKFAGTVEQDNVQEKWNVQAVLRYLHTLILAAKIPLQYNAPVDSLEKQQYVSNTVIVLGHFSLVGLSRLHCLLCDYRNSIKVLDLIDLRKKNLISQTPDCFTSAHYYLALSYLMTKRWSDCHNICVNILTPMVARRGDQAVFYNIDVKVERMTRKEDNEYSVKDIYHTKYLSGESMLLRCFALLTISHLLNNKTKHLDKQVYQHMESMFSDDFSQLNSNNINNINNINNRNNRNKNSLKKSNKSNKSSEEKKTDSDEKDNTDDNNNDAVEENDNLESKRKSFENLFLLGCPDFPNAFDLFGDSQISSIDAKELALNQFSKFFRSVNLNKSYEIRRMRDELKLYQSIPTKKLAKELEFGDSNAFEKELIQLKSKMRQFKQVDGVASNGEWSNQSDFDFFIKQDDINVRRVNSSRLGKYTDQFVKRVGEISIYIN